MSITKTFLKNLNARVTITPSPVTLSESTAVLKRLQSFGPVTSFTKVVPKNGSTVNADNTDETEVDVVFSSPETVQKACDASPFTVMVSQDVPDPHVADPYNVRNLQSRRQPKPNSMSCRVRLQELDDSLFSGQNILSSGFSPSNRTRLYQSLLDVKPPPNIMDGLGVLETDRPDILPTAHLTEAPPNLTTMYRSPPSSHRSGGEDRNWTRSAVEYDERSKDK
ncbi:hypothetical protein A1O3_01237 [Capronia epimyces CBS 606.96]|uniref:RRM domain-containing protein n=1 Tax=Capronia epimyces CBS 606.96 TaxID=1182542 RepID=W9YSN6_9EURO|nr:uncharacterized protein A1O3_01237 [Capronia epimyces CBS 606.96]EXJ92685.1 hypothetical protein A1O3_01237 [Capronia epimyces CBS 606.96]